MAFGTKVPETCSTGPSGIRILRRCPAKESNGFGAECRAPTLGVSAPEGHVKVTVHLFGRAKEPGISILKGGLRA